MAKRRQQREGLVTQAAVPWRTRLARLLTGWSKALDPSPPATALPPRSQLASPRAEQRLLPGVREPLSIERAVQERDMTLLRREAADALAALGAAHALMASARFTQLQDLREKGDSSDPEEQEQELAALAADYLGWQSDQVRLFDALSMVLEMRVPEGATFELIDPALRPAADQHLATLAAEYQRRQLDRQFDNEAAAAEGGAP